MQKKKTAFPSDYLENGFPRLQVCEHLNIVGDLGKCGRVVIGVDDQDVDSHWDALLDTVRCHHLEPRKNCLCRQQRFYTHERYVWLKDSRFYLSTAALIPRTWEGRKKIEQED